MRISDWSSDVCSSDLDRGLVIRGGLFRFERLFEIGAEAFGESFARVGGRGHWRRRCGSQELAGDEHPATPRLQMILRKENRPWPSKIDRKSTRLNSSP